MKIEDSTLKVGGNMLKLKIGNWIKSIGESICDYGDKIIVNNKPKLVTNPSGRLVNPYTLIINFRVDNNSKYQIVLQGDYKEYYKERDIENGNVSMTDETLFMIIYTNENLWFKKD
jgi:hypothetical protein